MIDQELLKACVINPWAVTPRMMLIDSMIETGWTVFKAMEAFEPPTVLTNLPSTYGIGSNFSGNSYGIGGGRGNSSSYGNGESIISIGSGGGIGGGIRFGRGSGHSFSLGIGGGYGYDDCGSGMILEQQ